MRKMMGIGRLSLISFNNPCTRSCRMPSRGPATLDLSIETQLNMLEDLTYLLYGGVILGERRTGKS